MGLWILYYGSLNLLAGVSRFRVQRREIEKLAGLPGLRAKVFKGLRSRQGV